MPFPGKQTWKRWRSLTIKKYRQKYRLFLVEGYKPVKALLNSSYGVEAVILTPSFENEFSSLPCPSYVVKPEQLRQLSTQQNPEGVIAIARLPSQKSFQQLFERPHPTLLLWNIQDPGNLGTLLRSALWFDFSRIVLLGTCVDPFNPKVVRASMGSLFFVELYFAHLETLKNFYTKLQPQMVIAHIEGIPLWEIPLYHYPYLLLGNETHGVKDFLAQWKDGRCVKIPCWGKGESLNVAIAGSLLMYQWQLSRQKTLLNNP